MLRVPCPAPKCHSASAAALASFSSSTCTPNTFHTASTRGTFFQPGRLGASITMPLTGFRGPGTLRPSAWRSPSGTFAPRSSTRAWSTSVSTSFFQDPLVQ